jgi:phytanoyl-CoA hydroxylase
VAARSHHAPCLLPAGCLRPAAAAGPFRPLPASQPPAAAASRAQQPSTSAGPVVAPAGRRGGRRGRRGGHLRAAWWAAAARAARARGGAAGCCANAPGYWLCTNTTAAGGSGCWILPSPRAPAATIMVLSATEGRRVRDFLCEHGYCVVPDVLTPEFAEQLRRETARLNAHLPHNPGQRFQGTHLDVAFDENTLYDTLAKWPPARAALDALGMGDFQSAGGLIVLTKEPRAPTLYWHQDWMHWNDPLSLTPWPQTIFLSYYLQGLDERNGCLQVVPGSHRRRTALHDDLQPLLGASEHGARAVKTMSFDQRKQAADELSPRQHAPPLFNEEHPLAVDVLAGPLDLVIADARVLHSARHNQTDHARDLLLLWHSRPGGQNHRGGQWSIPEWYSGPLPRELLERDDSADYPGTRIPGELLKHGGAFAAAPKL